MRSFNGQKILVWTVIGLLVIWLLVIAYLFLSDVPAASLIESAKGRLLSRPNVQLSNNEVNAIAHLTSIGAILPAEVVLSSIVDFYETIINALLALMTVLGIVAFMYVKSNSVEAAATHAQSAVTIYFESQKFSEMAADLIAKDVNEQIRDEIALQVSDFEDIREGMAEFDAFQAQQTESTSALENEIEDLKKELVALASVIAGNDDEEEIGTNENIQNQES